MSAPEVTVEAHLANGLPTFSAAVDQGPVTSGSEVIPLWFEEDYLAVCRYTAGNRQFTVQVYGGTNYLSLAGVSTAWATSSMSSCPSRGARSSAARTWRWSNR